MLIALRKVFVALEEVSRFAYIGHKFIDFQFTPVDRLIFTGWSDQGPHAHQTCNDSGVLHQFFFETEPAGELPVVLIRRE